MINRQPNIIFMGSPEISVPTLQALHLKYGVKAVFTQPDRMAGRGKKITVSAVKAAALELSLPVFQPVKLRNPESFSQLQDLQPDLIVVMAYGQILRKAVLDLPQYGCVNVHASLLPRWRGASPIQASILNGDQETGITIMKMDPGIDTGPILSMQKEAILLTDNSASLSERLSKSGAQLLMETLPGYLSGEIKPQPQPEEGATYASMINKQDGLLDFSLPAQLLEQQIRAYYPWPGSFFDLDGDIIKVHKAHVEDNEAFTPGERNTIHGFPAIGTNQGWLVLDEVQAPGKNAISGKAWLAGKRNFC